jgi:FlaA1/EpsC-like NDP-sugar epimerase
MTTNVASQPPKKGISFRRLSFFLAMDVVLVLLSLYLSLLLRFEFRLDPEYKLLFFQVAPLFVLCKIVLLWIFRSYNITWKFFGLHDLYNIGKALIVAELVLVVVILNIFNASYSRILPLLHPLPTNVPRSVFIIDALLSGLFITGLRISKRVVIEIMHRSAGSSGGSRTLIIGAGNTADILLRDMVRQTRSRFLPVGLLDDNVTKTGNRVHGIEVLGTTEVLASVIADLTIETVLIAIPSLNFKALRHICDTAREAGVSQIKIIPRIYDFNKPEIQLKNLEDISIEDLIGRQSVTVDRAGIEGMLRGKSVLITGAGGSIGSEIVLQVCGFGPAKVVLVDLDETALHSMQLKIKRLHPHLDDVVVYAVGDIRDKDRVTELFHTHRPQIVFHAAAYQHVPMMEENPREAVKTNMFGTRTIAQAAVDNGTNKFIMISTDKAVMPTSIMGATKRIAENICRAFNVQGGTEFIAVRFGNVLGSRGSVLPLFLEQLKHGGPLTVTHKDMQRYFMTIPEAVSLVLQASVIGRGGDVMVLDMGIPIMIVKLAEELIKLHGLKPYKDIDIVFTGMRPGEKLFEELLTSEEGTIATRSDKVFVARIGDSFTLRDVDAVLAEFRHAVETESMPGDELVRSLLRKHVRHYHDDGVCVNAPSANAATPSSSMTTSLPDTGKRFCTERSKSGTWRILCCWIRSWNSSGPMR